MSLVRTVRIFKDTQGFFRWTAVARNGEPVATSEGYRNRADCRRIARELFPGAVIHEWDGGPPKDGAAA